MRMHRGSLALSLVAFCLVASAAAAQSAPAVQGRAVLNCPVDDQRRLGACQVTYQDHPALHLGDLALEWAAGKTLPPLAEGQKGAPAIDLGLCFAISGQPAQASLDLSSPCQAIAKAPGPYGLADIVSAPKAAKLGVAGASPVFRVSRDDLLATGAGNIRDALAKMPSPAVANLSCSVLTSGALICNPSPQFKSTPATMEAALKIAQQIRVKVKQVDGLPAVGTLNFSLTPDRERP